MSNDVELKDFDILGIIEIKDKNEIKGIEKYVTPKYGKQGDKEPVSYFSRSKEYYNVKTITELSKEREELKALADRCKTKRNFVIFENMLNCSGRAYFKLFEEYLKNKNNDEVKKSMEIAKLCMMEDTKNLVSILSNEGLININANLKLPHYDRNVNKRAIEMDNKAMLYIFSKALKFNPKIARNIHVITPGYGSTYIGPFLNVVQGFEFTNLLKSKYISESLGDNENLYVKDMVSDYKIFDKTKKVILLDDNVGTGVTLNEVKELLEDSNIKIYKTGAVQYNWKNFLRVSIGEKVGIDRFNIDDFDIITPFNYAGHKLYEHAISELHSSGNDYESYLNMKSYRKKEYCDTEGAIIRTIKELRRIGINIIGDEKVEPTEEVVDEYRGKSPVITSSMKKMINKFITITGRSCRVTRNKRQISR